MIYLTNFCSALKGDSHGQVLGWFAKQISKSYTDGDEKFIDFAFENVVGGTRIHCPFKKCCNLYFVRREVADDDMVGMMQCIT